MVQVINDSDNSFKLFSTLIMSYTLILRTKELLKQLKHEQLMKVIVN